MAANDPNRAWSRGAYFTGKSKASVVRNNQVDAPVGRSTLQSALIDALTGGSPRLNTLHIITGSGLHC
jgi:hypothetical protein